jgi:hypothetical protein
MKWRTPIYVAFLAACILKPSFASAQESAPQDRLTLSFPGKNWVIEINSPGFVVESQDRKPDGREYLLARNPKAEIVLSVTLEQAKGGANGKTCPDYLHKRMDSMSSLNPSEVSYSEIAQMAVVEYFVASIQGMPVRQKNFVACTTNDDVYVDIHLSKAKFQSSDESLFTDVLSHVRVTDRVAAVAAKSSPASPSAQSGSSINGAVANSGASSMDYFREGSRHFMSQDYRGAIAPYESALDMEKKTSRLSTDLWRVLVDNLAMAYGISGDLDSSERTYDYGLGKDPSYPGFYYGMACVWAERNNMNNAMDNLQKAFALKANVIPGESIPDPRHDDSFQRFMSNSRFRKFVDSLYSTN